MLRSVIHLIHEGGVGYMSIDDIWVRPTWRLQVPDVYETDPTKIPALKRVTIRYDRGDGRRFVVRLPTKGKVIVKNYTSGIRAFYETPSGKIQDMLSWRRMGS